MIYSTRITSALLTPLDVYIIAKSNSSRNNDREIDTGNFTGPITIYLNGMEYRNRQSQSGRDKSVEKVVEVVE